MCVEFCQITFHQSLSIYHYVCTISCLMIVGCKLYYQGGGYNRQLVTNLVLFVLHHFFPHSGVTSERLQEVPIPLISTDRCRDILGSNGIPGDTVLCAGRPEGGIDTCQVG